MKLLLIPIGFLALNPVGKIGRETKLNGPKLKHLIYIDYMTKRYCHIVNYIRHCEGLGFKIQVVLNCGELIKNNF